MTLVLALVIAFASAVLTLVICTCTTLLNAVWEKFLFVSQLIGDLAEWKMVCVFDFDFNRILSWIRFFFFYFCFTITYGSATRSAITRLSHLKWHCKRVFGEKLSFHFSIGISFLSEVEIGIQKCGGFLYPFFFWLLGVILFFPFHFLFWSHILVCPIERTMKLK